MLRENVNDLLGRRRAFLTAKRLLTNQSFRDIYRTDTLDVDQRLPDGGASGHRERGQDFCAVVRLVLEVKPT